ncbi:Hint domain-containing protein [Acidiphilium sp.]|uniref:Hint domain-containing protein n=1 Tax=Acidiphilium sp. TaxID=527 RepID=UPI003CFF3118
MSTGSTIVHTGITLETNPTIIVSPVDTVFNTTTSIATGSYVIYASVFSDNPGTTLTNASTISVSGTIIDTAARGMGGTIGIEAAVNLRGLGNLFVNQGLVSSTGLQAIKVPNYTQYGTIQTDGVYMNGGTVINQAGGTIEANAVAVYIANYGGVSASILNEGVILGTSFAGTFTFAGSLDTYVTFGNGVDLGDLEVAGPNAGIIDTLTNGGTIFGAPGIIGHGHDIINNSGTIGGIALVNKYGVSFTGSSSYSGVAIYGQTNLSRVSSISLATGIPSTLDITNSGLIESAATDGTGIVLQYGSIDNVLGGTIAGYKGAVRLSDAATLANYGMILGAVSLDAGGTVMNFAGATIDGVHQDVGVVLNGGTLIDAGLVNGAGGPAVRFGTAGGTVVIEPGASFIGAIAATDAADVVEFAAGTEPGGTIALSSSFGGATDLSFAPGASLTVEGGIAQLAQGQTINGFALGDTIQLDGFAATSDSFVTGTGLELFSGSSTITLDIVGNFTTADFIVTDPPANTTIALVPCFAAGTEILTADGPRPVEALRVGDWLVLHGGGAAPIVWLGQRRLDLRRHARPAAVQPIVIEVGAICDGVPARALTVSPDHALYLDGHLVPAKALLNGVTIRQVSQPSVTYFHVELAVHAVIYAEGCPVESYLDTGNRAAFEHGGALTLHPDFAQDRREAEGCAPFAEAGAVVEALRAGLLARAGVETTRDADVRTRRRRDGAWVIESRSGIPGEITADPRDRRRLGVKIAALLAGRRMIDLDDPSLVEGWHDAEADGRWTDGAAVVPAALMKGTVLEIRLAASAVYHAAEPPCQFSRRRRQG